MPRPFLVLREGRRRSASFLALRLLFMGVTRGLRRRVRPHPRPPAALLPPPLPHLPSLGAGRRMLRHRNGGLRTTQNGPHWIASSPPSCPPSIPHLPTKPEWPVTYHTKCFLGLHMPSSRHPSLALGGDRSPQSRRHVNGGLRTINSKMCHVYLDVALDLRGLGNLIPRLLSRVGRIFWLAKGACRFRMQKDS